MLSVVADFDGTLLKYDLAELALKRFGRRGWERYDELLNAGEITVEQCVARQYAMIDVRSQKQVTDYIDAFCVFRPGCGALLSECGREGVRLFVVSAGLDFCIRYAFHRSGLRMPELVCPKSSLVPRHGFGLSIPPRFHAASRDFKEDMVMHHKGQGSRVVFLGDGAGDFNAAAAADLVFAIRGSRLDTMCSDRRIPHRSVATLAPVARFVHTVRF